MSETTNAIANVPSSVSDPRPGFIATHDLATTVLAAVGASDLSRPTPCDDFTVGDLVGHLVCVVRRVAAAGRGEDLRLVPSTLPGLTPEAAVAAFAEARDEQTAVWLEADVLGRMLVLPFGTLPGTIALGIYTSEVTAHTWDLATAIGVDVDWDDQLILGVLAGMRRGLPAVPRGAEVGVPFGAVVQVPDDAEPIDRLVAWLGRRPDWVA